MDSDQREDLKAGSTLVNVASQPSKEAKCFIEYATDDAAAKYQVKIVVFNSRNKSAPRLLLHRGKDYIRTLVSGPKPDHSPTLGDPVFVTHFDNSLEREAKRRIRAADSTRGEFKGDAGELEKLMNRLVAHIKKEDKPVLVSFDPGTHKLG